jgi:hypothetical protein
MPAMMKKTKSLLFLGAGASIPYFNPRLSTAHLTNLIKTHDKWEDIVPRYTNNVGVNINTVRVEPVFGILDEMSNKFPEYNFEQIIEIFDKICSFNFDSLPNSKILHDLLLMYGARPHVFEDHVWDPVPFLFRQIISEEVAELFQNHKAPAYDELRDLQTCFIESITTQQDLNIFTLNYDEIVLDSIERLPISTGFDDGRFSIPDFFSAANTISFPHGHSRFSYDDMGILYHDSGVGANQHRLAHIGKHDWTKTRYIHPSHYSYSFNTFITTGQQKEPSFDINPYAAYYQKFAADCIAAEKIFIMGYSLSDYHFNRMLMNFLRLRPTNKLIVVDYIAGDLNILSEFLNSGSFIHRMFMLMDITSIPVNDNQHYQYEEEELRLNQRGYATIYPQIFLYKKGYDAFLREFETLPI